MPRIFLSTTEASAERHASHLVAALRHAAPEIRIDAAGGDVMAQAGAEVAVDTSGRSVMGFWEVFSHLAFYKRAGETILATLQRTRPDALVLVDAPSFHLRVAQRARARWPDLPILYYIAPKAWAWKERRVKNLRRDVTRTLCIFPFEVPFFRERGVDAVYVGNPTLDQLRAVDGKDMSKVLHVENIYRHSHPDKGVLAVFPGSRTSELKYLWPTMVHTIALLRRRFPDLKAAVALAPGWTSAKLAAIAPLPDNTMFIPGESQALLAAASVVLAKSGTTTLEAALLGKPMVVCYAGHATSYHIAKMFVKLPYISLPNILAGKKLVKEFIQHEATPENLAGEIGLLLSDHRYYRKMRASLLALKDTLGDEHAAARAAREVLAFCGGPAGGENV
ncbi:MAG: lipid-A-disaccharide synthase [Planctomycetes bacterium]|nr:lipid-A-disaccharide synthase [Planctomycetota bacterium]